MNNSNNILDNILKIIDNIFDNIFNNNNKNNIESNDKIDDKTKIFDFNPLIKSFIDDFQKSFIKYINEEDIYKLDKIKIYTSEFIKSMSVIKNKRKISKLELYFQSRKIIKDFEIKIFAIKTLGQKESDFINNFDSYIKDIRKWFNILSILISMYYNFNILMKDDLIYKIKILNYAISIADLINSVFENMIDIYPDEMGWVSTCSYDLVNLIFTIKTLRTRLRHRLNRLNNIKPVFLYNTSNKYKKSDRD